MGDRYPSLPQGPGNLLVQVEVCPTARSEVPNHQDPYLPDSLWWQYVAHAYSQVRFESTGNGQRLIATYPTHTGNDIYYFRRDKPSCSVAADGKRTEGQITHPSAESESRKATSDLRSQKF